MFKLSEKNKRVSYNLWEELMRKKTEEIFCNQQNKRKRSLNDVSNQETDPKKIKLS